MPERSHMPAGRVLLKGSARQIIADAQVIGSPDPSSSIAVTVLLRRRNSDLPAPGTETLTREEFARRFGADPADVIPVERFATENDLSVVEVDLARRSIVLAGTV